MELFWAPLVTSSKSLSFWSHAVIIILSGEARKNERKKRRKAEKQEKKQKAKQKEGTHEKTGKKGMGCFTPKFSLENLGPLSSKLSPGSWARASLVWQENLWKPSLGTILVEMWPKLRSQRFFLPHPPAERQEPEDRLEQRRPRARG